jgi:hypothetical protein
MGIGSGSTTLIVKYMCYRREITLWAGSSFVLLDPDPADQNQCELDWMNNADYKYQTCDVGEGLHSGQEAVLSFWIRIQLTKIKINGDRIRMHNTDCKIHVL